MKKKIYFIGFIILFALIATRLYTMPSEGNFIPGLTISPIIYKVILGILGIAYLINAYVEVRSSVKDKSYGFALFQVLIFIVLSLLIILY